MHYRKGRCSGETRGKAGGCKETDQQRILSTLYTCQASSYFSFKGIIKIHILNETSDTEFLASFPSPKGLPIMEELREEQTDIDYIPIKHQVLYLHKLPPTIPNYCYTDEETESQRG